MRTGWAFGGERFVIVVVGLDWQTASVGVRELFALPSSAEPSFMEEALGLCGARGCVLLKTCNRFEIYLDFADTDAGSPRVDGAAAAICDFVLSLQDPSKITEKPELFTLAGADAAIRLMTIASGLKSQVLGEDQIISQVRDAQTGAREAGCITPELETLFRIAVTCGKAVRTNVEFHQEGTSCARTAIEIAQKELGSLVGLRALVIGNGEMGRLAASLLVAQGCDTSITLRTYRHGPTLVPAGCGAISYDDRLSFMAGCDVVVSATKSQHVTVSRNEFFALTSRPRVILDLAMPRDIDPACGEADGVSLYDIDDMRDDGSDSINAEAMDEAMAIVGKHLQDFNDWCAQRARRVGRR